jgi:heme A synthase
MNTRAYTVLGWITWQVATRVAKRKMSQNKAKIGAAATVLLVLVGGLVAAKAAGGSDQG